MKKRLRLIAVGTVASGLVLIAAVMLMVRSGWLGDRVREKIVEEVENATGGRVEIGAFRLSFIPLRVELENFVIHGTEPSGSAPLFQSPSVAFTLTVPALLRRSVDIESLEVARPQANLLISPTGETNVPGPKNPQASRPVVDMALAYFAVRDGEFNVNSARNPWSASGKNFHAVFRESPGQVYEGQISIQPLDLTLGKYQPVALQVNTQCTVRKNRVEFSNTTLATADSTAELTGAINNLGEPQTEFRYKLRLSLAEAGRVLRLRTPQHGIVEIAGNGHFASAADYLVAGRLNAADLSFGNGDHALRGVRAESAVRVDPQKIELSGLRVEALGGRFNGHTEITGLDRLRLEGEFDGLDTRRVLSLYGSRPAPWDGSVSGSIDVRGLISELNQERFRAHGQIVISPVAGQAPVRGAIEATYDGQRGLVEFADSHLTLPSTQLDFSGTLGRQMHVRLKSANLEDFAPVLDGPPPIGLAETPQARGLVSFDGTVTGELNSPQIAGRLALQNFTYQGQRADAFLADMAVSKSSARLQSASIRRGSMLVQFEGTAGLVDWQVGRQSPVDAKASVQVAKLEELEALAGADVPIRGSLAANARISGLAGDPRVQGDLSLSQGSISGEPFDRITAKLGYAAKQAQASSGEIAAGTRRVQFDLSYQHTDDDLRRGRLTLHATSNRLALDQVRNLRTRWPDTGGEIQLTAAVIAVIAADANGGPVLKLEELTADVQGFGVKMDGKSLGDVHLTSKTQNQVLDARLDMTVAGSTVRAQGQWRLETNYPGTMQATFTRLDFAKLAAWYDAPEHLKQLNGWAEGKLSMAGPAFQPAAWTGSIELPNLEIAPVPSGAAAESGAPLTLKNSEPIRLMLEKSVVRVESARLAGRNTDFSITGTASLGDTNPLNLRATGAIDLAVLQDFHPELAGSGQLVTDAVIRGPALKPQITGQMELKNASLTVADFPNALSQINGTLVFEGSRASIQHVTAETGGGKVTLGGFIYLAMNEPAFRIDATARQVRLRYPEGASTVADAELIWTGSSPRSVLSGTVTILRTGLNRRTDFSTLFAHSTDTARVVANPTGLLGGVQFDVQIETAPGVSFQTSLAQNLQADASLRLRGTIANPVLLGRINISQGEMTFFGNKYTISQGSISFFNPVKLEPNLNLDLQTRARGIDITLGLTGPINKLSVNYRSDPPLQFSDIVALLATGRAPSSDPGLRQSGTAQSWQQAGASGLVGQALASNGGSGRLERFFGVSKIKIDPQLTGVDSNPQARLTMEQQVTPNVTLTYLTNLTRTNSQFVRIEWSLNREWSLIAVREENSEFGLDFQYKKRFK